MVHPLDVCAGLCCSLILFSLQFLDVKSYEMPWCSSKASVEVREEKLLSRKPLLSTLPRTHKICRNSAYVGGVERSPVADKRVSWKKSWKEYSPVEYTAPLVLAKPVWADDPQYLRKMKFNTDDDGVNRKSFMGGYVVDSITSLPINPVGRTGMKGRGLLGRFGPNFAADPIVSRWKRDEKGNTVLDKRGRKIVEVVVITRRDNGQKAIPGGMVDKGEQVSATLKREFGEEALNSMELSDKARANLLKDLDDKFQHGVLVYQGYVDDPRNTDNAWMETTAILFHDDDGSLFSSFHFQAGDDASGVEWLEITPDIDLYANHEDFVLAAYKFLVGKRL
eukprot:m.14003 g.14003  ORF g.14003 m.14003 type:complete len:336 (+) comp4240_c0_seq1:66-1073(+)